MYYQKTFLVMVLTLLGHSAFAQNPSNISSVLPPDVDVVKPSKPGDLTERSSEDGDYTVSVKDADHLINGFSFINKGPNRVMPIVAKDIGLGPDREFSFYFRDRARQDIYIAITDTPTAFLSQRMESYFYFFPRVNIPAIEVMKDNPGNPVFKVTIQTGEVILFDGNSKEVIGGVLKELAPIDLNPDRFSRKFPQIQYSGKGVQIRVNKRGGDPRLGTIASITQGAKTCKLPSSMLFDQREDSDVNFLFPTDEEFNAFLIKNCKISFL